MRHIGGIPVSVEDEARMRQRLDGAHLWLDSREAAEAVLAAIAEARRIGAAYAQVSVGGEVWTYRII